MAEKKTSYQIVYADTLKPVEGNLIFDTEEAAWYYLDHVALFLEKYAVVPVEAKVEKTDSLKQEDVTQKDSEDDKEKSPDEAVEGEKQQESDDEEEMEDY